MKGITPVIAVILLLLITISMVGFTFVWLTRLSSTLQTKTSESINATYSFEQRVRIDNINPSTNVVTIRAVGSQSVPTSSIQVYVNGNGVTCGWSAPTLVPQGTVDCTLSPPGCASGGTLKVSAPGGQDQTTC